MAEPDGEARLKRHRTHINNVNEAIVQKIAARMEQVEEIKRIKSEIDREITDESREETVKRQFRGLFRDEGIDGEYGERLAELLIEIAKDEQRS